MHSFYSHGKLLLTGEYVVLDGALGLALPTKKGQSLTIKPIDDNKLYWKSIRFDGSIWFKDNFELEHLDSVINKNEIANMLQKILGVSKQLNSEFLSDNRGYEITTTLEFPTDWGLGSSSTLINNIASWAQVDPYKLLKSTFGGSGYDVACAKSNGPLIYQLKESFGSEQDDNRLVEKVTFEPVFSGALYFVHLNKKQDSREGISRYTSKKNANSSAIDTISGITKSILGCSSLNDFNVLINKHEEVISKLIDQPTVKEQRFHDFNGSVKSLGAWGGDFVLATATKDPTEYFKEKGYETIIPFDTMILK